MPRTDIKLKDLSDPTEIAKELLGLRSEIVGIKEKLNTGLGISGIDHLGNANFNLEQGFVSARNAPLIEEFEYGEEIDEKKVVCFKVSNPTTVSLSNDTYVNEQSPTTNYDSTSQIDAGTNDVGGTDYQRWILLDFAKPVDFPYKVELNLNLVQLLEPNDITYTVKVITTSWTSSTVTWNTKPTLGASIITFNPSGLGSLTLDLTNQMRIIDVDAGAFEGLAIVPGNTNVNTNTIDRIGILQATATLNYEKASSDGKVYIADNTDYATCSRVIGVTREKQGANQKGKVQIAGIIEDIGAGTAGQLTYLKTTGTIGRLAEARWLDFNNWVLEMGKIFLHEDGVSSNLFLDIQKTRPFYIETLTESHTEGNSATKLYPVTWASQALIEYHFNNANSKQQDKNYVWLYRTSHGHGNFDTKDSFNDTSQGNHINFNWDSIANTITFEVTNPSTIGATISAFIFE